MVKSTTDRELINNASLFRAVFSRSQAVEYKGVRFGAVCFSAPVIVVITLSAGLRLRIDIFRNNEVGSSTTSSTVFSTSVCGYVTPSGISSGELVEVLC